MLIQIATYIIPLVELPFLTRVLSPKVFGQIFFLQAISLVLSFIVEYGFNLRATKLFLRCANVNDKASLIGLVFQAKIVLFIFAYGLFLFLFFITNGFFGRINLEHIGVVGLIILGTGFSSFWYYQARELMGWTGLWELSCRIAYLLLIVVFVNNDSDMNFILYVFAICSVMSTLGELIWLFNKENFKLSPWSIVWVEIIDGWHTFVYKNSSSLMSTMSVWILGLISSSTAVAYYVGADKIIKAMVGLSQPVILASYPYFSRLAVTNQHKSYTLIIKYAIATIILSLPVLLSVFFLSPYIINIFLGGKYVSSIETLQILLLVIPFRVLNTIIGHLGLLAQNKDKLVSKLTLIVSGTGIFLCFIGGYSYHHLGMAVAVVMIEVILFVLYLNAFLSGRNKQ